MTPATLLLPFALLQGPALRPRNVPTFHVTNNRAAVNMAISLPFGGGGQESSGPSEEVQAKYRLLGLAEDAGYDDINRAYDELAGKYEGDPKMTIKLQVAKDAIFDHLLRQRMSGALKGTVAESPFDRKEEPKPLIKIPVFLADVMELPTRQYLVKNAAVFGAVGLLGVLSKAWASTSVGLGFATGLFLLYNRGAPESSNDMDAEMRPPKVRPLLLAAGITILAGALGATLSQLVHGAISAISQEGVISMCTSFFFFVSATLFKVQDEY